MTLAERDPVSRESLRKGVSGRRLRRPLRVAARRRRDHQGRGRGARRRRRSTTSSSTRRATATTSTRSGATWLHPRRMQRRPGALLDEAIAADNACLARRGRLGDDAGDPPLPRQQPQPVVRRGRLRCDRREALQHARRRPLPARVRRRALGARSSRCGSCRRTRPSCSAWSAAKSRSSRAPTRSRGGSSRRRSTFRSSIWR